MNSRFQGPLNLAVIVCSRVLERSSPVLHVSHDEEGDWQFLCDGDHGHDHGDRGRVLSLGEVLALDSSLEGLAGLPEGFRAWRSAAGAAWRVEPSAPDRHA